MEAEGLIENSASTGAYLLTQLREMAARHPIVGDVRGIGLLQQVELVKDRETREPFSREDDLQSKVGDRLLARGLLCRAGSNISIAPPLILNREDADAIAEILDIVLTEVEEIL
jgi:4-aminobutyrate aminotransferase-like enzyme